MPSPDWPTAADTQTLRGFLPIGENLPTACRLPTCLPARLTERKKPPSLSAYIIYIIILPYSAYSGTWRHDLPGTRNRQLPRARPYPVIPANSRSSVCVCVCNKLRDSFPRNYFSRLFVVEYRYIPFSSSFPFFLFFFFFSFFLSFLSFFSFPFLFFLSSRLPRGGKEGREETRILSIITVVDQPERRR